MWLFAEKCDFAHPKINKTLILAMRANVFQSKDALQYQDSKQILHQWCDLWACTEPPLQPQNVFHIKSDSTVIAKKSQLQWTEGLPSFWTAQEKSPMEAMSELGNQILKRIGGPVRVSLDGMGAGDRRW